MLSFLEKIFGFICAFFTIHRFKRLISKENSDIFFFFPTWEFGGVERISLKVIDSIKDQKPTCLITYKPNNDGFRKDFEEKCYTLKLGYWAGQLRVLTLPILAKYLNSKTNPIIIGANSTYFYDLIPYLKSHVKIIDIDHSFNKAVDVTKLIQYYSKNTIQRINKRIVLGEKGVKENIDFYNSLNITVDKNKFIPIPNAVETTSVRTPINNREKNIIFVGRNDDVKRVNIFLETARKIKKSYSDYNFICVGNFPNSLSEEYPEITFTGVITDINKLNDIYSSSRMIILCSKTEGLPMVILEAMSRGVVPITVNVGELEYIINRNNGVLIENSINDFILIDIFSNEIEKLILQPHELEQLSINSFELISQHYDILTFKNKYRNLILNTI